MALAWTYLTRTNSASFLNVPLQRTERVNARGARTYWIQLDPKPQDMGSETKDCVFIR